MGKDGPSAGSAIIVALVSLFTGQCVRSDTAMTGEVTLRGLVLPVGGVVEKVLAAHRAGVRHVILPKNNEKDLRDISDTVKVRKRGLCFDVMLLLTGKLVYLLFRVS